ncbi:hypothetical protein GUA87_17570 [Sneathiella sp. P13V-1]|nr:hypothetical protein [Sneathiella sp. P13V-1]MBE7638669.1 hypothetical protein [Sneathiella sp. P13V-1]
MKQKILKVIVTIGAVLGTVILVAGITNAATGGKLLDLSSPVSFPVDI